MKCSRCGKEGVENELHFTIHTVRHDPTATLGDLGFGFESVLCGDCSEECYKRCTE